jgi:plastocyanin
MPARRRLLLAGAVLLAAPALRRALAVPAVVEVQMRSDPDGARVGFDPIGLRVAPGTAVRWLV